MSQKPEPSIDPFQFINATPNPDGTITRHTGNWPKTAATPDPPDHVPVLTKDVTINQSNNVWVRIYLPRRRPPSSSAANNKLPLIVYFHGGGFIICNADLTVFHNFISDMAVQVQVAVVSVEYRLAPEHRLPAAYDDAMEVLHWIRDTPDEWLQTHVDLSDCFLMGSSAGGNIAYHAGLRAAAGSHDDHECHLLPLEIGGLILHQPFFGGVKRTGSEIRLVNDKVLPACASDILWELSLPIGADRDHEYSNPTAEGRLLKVADKVKGLGWKVMVTGCDGDPLIDRQIEVVKIMEEKGVRVVTRFTSGGFHGFEFYQRSDAEAFFAVLKDFVFSSKLDA